MVKPHSLLLVPRPQQIGLVLAMLLVASACSSEDGHGADHQAVTSPGSDCGGLADAYRSGISKTSDGGITVAIATADPTPPKMGDNSWTIEISDASGAPIVGANVTLSGWMPEHGHGLNTIPVATELGAGRYRLEPINLFMPSVWEVTIEVTQPGAQTAESVLFKICVPAN
jgi:hypothetical protein